MTRCIYCGVWTNYGITCSKCRVDPLDEDYSGPTEEEDEWEEEPEIN